MISSELFNLLWPNIVWWCVIMSQSVLQKDCLAVIKVIVWLSSRWLFGYQGHWLMLIKYDLVHCVFKAADPFAAKLYLMVYLLYAGVSWKEWIVVFTVNVTVKVQNFTGCLSVLHFLYQWHLCSQARCVDALLPVTRPSANKAGTEI